MSDVNKTIEKIRALTRNNDGDVGWRWIDADDCENLKCLADAYEALQAEHQEMMQFFGIEYEMFDGERHWKYSPASMKKFRLVQNDSEYEVLQAEIAELREALGKVADVLDYGRRHSHGMYGFTKMKEGYEKAEALIADVLDKHKEQESK